MMSSPQMLELTSAPPRIRVFGRMVGLDLLAGLAVAALLVLLGFTTRSGIIEGSVGDLGANTWMEIILTVLGAGSLVTVLLWSPRGPANGALALLAFAALTTLTAVSIAWSVQPDASWTAANESVAYLGAFGAAIALARLFPGRWRALTWALPVAAVALSGYALLGKVFPALPDTDARYGRLIAPLGYWNAVGLIAGFGLPGCLFVGSRRASHRAVRAASIPAVAILVATLVLSYSRSTDAAAVLSVALLLALAPSRMRMTLVLLPGLVGGAAISARMLASHALSDNISGGLLDGHGDTIDLRTSAGHSFGVFVLLALVILSAFAYWLIGYADRTELSAQTHKRIARALLGLAACVPLAALVKLASSQRGLFGEISHVWNTLTSTDQYIGTGASRITSFANSRPAYWHDALLVGSHHLVVGAGALGYATARTRYTHFSAVVETAHGYLFQTFADLGIVGLLVSLVVFAAWGRAAGTTIGRRAVGGRGEERTAMLTLLAVVVCFGVNSTLDWTWFIPVTALPALVCAGWLAGRGPLAAPVGRLTRRRQILGHPALPGSVAAIAVVALALGWGIWQPLRSVQALNASVAAAAGGDSAVAFADARTAVSRDPFSLSAIENLASLDEGARLLGRAHSEFVLETQRVPDDFQSWYDVGTFDLRHHHLKAAIADLQHAAVLDPFQYPVAVAQAKAGQELARKQAKAAARAAARAARAKAKAAAAAAAARARAQSPGIGVTAASGTPPSATATTGGTESATGAPEASGEPTSTDPVPSASGR